jgi:hypothetical protein
MRAGPAGQSELAFVLDEAGRRAAAYSPKIDEFSVVGVAELLLVAQHLVLTLLLSGRHANQLVSNSGVTTGVPHTN